MSYEEWVLFGQHMGYVGDISRADAVPLGKDEPLEEAWVLRLYPSVTRKLETENPC